MQINILLEDSCHVRGLYELLDAHLAPRLRGTPQGSEPSAEASQPQDKEADNEDDATNTEAAAEGRTTDITALDATASKRDREHTNGEESSTATCPKLQTLCSEQKKPPADSATDEGAPPQKRAKHDAGSEKEARAMQQQARRAMNEKVCSPSIHRLLTLRCEIHSSCKHMIDTTCSCAFHTGRDRCSANVKQSSQSIVQAALGALDCLHTRH